MSVPVRKPWSQEQFFSWAARQEGRYEFDGFEPIDMTGGTINHSLIMRNLHDALRTRLRGSGCQNLGPDAGLSTTGSAIRYPDALVTGSRLLGTAMTVPDAVIVFEVLGPTSGRTDRIVKTREYAAVESIRRYIILESASVGLTVFQRPEGTENWIATTLTSEDDHLQLPEIGISVPVGDLYAEIDFGSESETAAIS